jgi:hypothetical protein
VHVAISGSADGAEGAELAGVAVRAIQYTSEEAVSKAQTEAPGPFRQGDGSYAAGAMFRYLIATA